MNKKYFSILYMMLQKDFLSESRERLNLMYLLILAPTISLILLIFNNSDNVIHLYFLSILIIGLMTNQRISRQEISPSGDLILISAPIDMSIFCLSKILFAFILNIFMSLVVFATFLLISSGSFFNKLPNFVILAIFFLLGLSVILTMFSLMLERVKTEGQFMLIMVYPLIIPFLILSHNSLIEINYVHFSAFISSFSLQVLIAFDILLLAICPILFSYSVRR
mgnify:FL=1